MVKSSFLGASTLAILIVISSAASTYGAEVTNEQLRDGLLSLVHSYSLLENKLDRHEQRERALGEIIKRSLQTLQKGQKIFEPMSATFERLDERMSQIESALIAQDEKVSDQQSKSTKALDTITKWIGANSSDKSNEDDDENLTKKVEDLSDNIKALQRQIAEMMADKASVEEISKGLLAETEKLVNSKLASADEVISRIEKKLSHFYITDPVPTTKNSEWEENITKSIDDINTNLKSALKGSGSSTSTGIDFDRDFFVTIANETLEAIEDMRIEVLKASDKSFSKTATRIKESETNLDTSINEILKTIHESATSSDSYYEAIKKSNDDLKTNITALNKIETILLQTADDVLSIKRGMEFNVHSVTLQVGDIFKETAKELNRTFNTRFDILNETISSNHNGALSNLTAKIETEISQVWRQIGIMYQEVSSSKQALNKLQEQTEAYVNGTFTTMDSMEGKVSQITGRMAEVDSNLNYLLGRLSLVTQEFNQIKSGLGSALDNIRSSFQIVQNKIQDVGPGPHQIPQDENETDSNLTKLH